MIRRIPIRLALALSVLLPVSGCNLHPHGRYQDVAGNYIDFHYFGNAYTNLDAGGGEAKVTFDSDQDRVVLHEPDGNPVLHVLPNGALCCGPAGLFFASGQRERRLENRIIR